MKIESTLSAALRLLMLGASCALIFSALPAQAQEAQIRKAFSERLPGLPKIDEVNKTPIPGLYEVRIGTELIYSDETGNYLMQGKLIDTKTREDLTAARIDKLTAIDFASLPMKDAMVMKKGNGSRKLVIFADPNCIYCKRFEKDLEAVNNVTVYTFLYPILGGDSPEKSRDIWCSKDAMGSWQKWMLDGTAPQRSMSSSCDTPMERNLALGKKYRVTGTPAIVFEDGTRAPGAISAAEVEKKLAATAASRAKS
jgi:thiol:disulfide interchange protein DsbC